MVPRMVMVRRPAGGGREVLGRGEVGPVGLEEWVVGWGMVKVLLVASAAVVVGLREVRGRVAGAGTTGS